MHKPGQENRGRNDKLIHQVVMAEVLAALFGMLVGLVIQAYLQADSVNVQPAFVVIFLEVTTDVPAPKQTITIGATPVKFLPKSSKNTKEKQDDKDIPSNSMHNISLGRRGQVDVNHKEYLNKDAKTAKMDWVIVFQLKKKQSSIPVAWKISGQVKAVSGYVQIGNQVQPFDSLGPVSETNFLVGPDRVNMGPNFRMKANKK